MATIKTVTSREILDSRGTPTIECSLWLDTGHQVTTSVPSGTSIGKYEAVELRDHDQSRMLGQGVLKAVENLNTIIAPQLVSKDPTQQAELDTILTSLDDTPNRSKLGANAILAASQAILKAGAIASGMPLYYYLWQKYQLNPTMSFPTCIYTLINGGSHGADNLDIQEFQVIPASFLDFPNSLNMGTTLFHKLEDVLVAKGAIHSTGLVGGFAPNLYNNTDALEILVETIKTSPYTLAQDLFFGVDMAAAEFTEAGKYHLKDKNQPYSSNELIDYYKSMRSLFHVLFIEDPFDDDDLKSWQTLTAELKATTMIAGDSFLATNKTKVQKAIEDQLCNAILIKPNQVGTITETLEVVTLARAAGWQIIASHRSGETADDLIADLAVGLGCDYVKFGPPFRGERIAKYNRLLQIHTEIQGMSQNHQA